MFSLFCKRPTKQTRRPQLTLEALEDRAVPATFNVNNLADILNPSGGAVTLRSALEAANQPANQTGANTINLTVPGTYRLGLLGTAQEADNAAGELAYTGSTNLNIVNTSNGNVIIDGGGLSRVFDINPSAQNTTPFTVTFTGLTIQNGAASPGDGDFGSGGGIRAQGAANIVLNGDNLLHNTATADGGGISLESLGNVGVGTLTIVNSTIANNHAGDAGGGVETDGNGLVTINTSNIDYNTCVNQGAGVWLDAGTANLMMTGDTVNGNVAQFMLAGGIGNAGSGSVTLTSCLIENNSSGSSLQMVNNTPTLVGGTGGGFGDAANTGNLTVINCFFVNNSAAGNGGGIQEGGPQTTITNTVFEDNVSGGNGGGVFVNGQTVTIANTVFRENVAVNGGGVEEDAATFTVTTSTFDTNRALGTNGGNGNTAGPGGSGGGLDVQANAATVSVGNSLFLDNIASNGPNGGGGGIFDGSGILTISNSQFTGNFASSLGGALSFGGTNLTITGSTFNGNSATGQGGALFYTGMPSTGASALTNDTFTGNMSNADGGAIEENGLGTLEFFNDTINGNKSVAGNGGGIAFESVISAVFQNTIVGQNTPNDVSNGLVGRGSPVTDQGGNLIGTTNGTVTFGSGTLMSNPLLGRLEDNGGQFAGAFSDQQIVQTEALLPGSPAIGSGVGNGAPTTDQRGFSENGGAGKPSIGGYAPQWQPGANANTIYVENVYEVLLNRPTDPGAVFWVNLLNNGTSPISVVQGIESSPEYRTDLVESLYQRYLDRKADQAGLTYYVNLLGKGLTVEQVEAQLVSSAEFFQMQGSTNAGFLEAFYQDALNRLPDSRGLVGFEQALANGASRGTVAAMIFGSAEFQADLIAADFQSVLGRGDDADDVAFFGGELQKGLSDQTILAQILGSGEAFAART